MIDKIIEIREKKEGLRIKPKPQPEPAPQPFLQKTFAHEMQIKTLKHKN